MTTSEAKHRGMAILEGLILVARDNETRRFSTPDGRFPCCKPKLWTTICERCGSDISQMIAPQACPDIPYNERWDITFSETITDNPRLGDLMTTKQPQPPAKRISSAARFFCCRIYQTNWIMPGQCRRCGKLHRIQLSR